MRYCYIIRNTLFLSWFPWFSIITSNICFFFILINLYFLIKFCYIFLNIFLLLNQITYNQILNLLLNINLIINKSFILFIVWIDIIFYKMCITIIIVRISNLIDLKIHFINLLLICLIDSILIIFNPIIKYGLKVFIQNETAIILIS